MSLGDAMRWVLPNAEVDVLFVDERPSDVQVASAIDMKVTQTEPGVKGDTASGGGSKPATLESGVTVQVPLFIEEGESDPGRHSQRRVRLARLSGRQLPKRENRRPCAGQTNAATPSSPATSATSPVARSTSWSPTRARFTRELAAGVEAHREELDDEIAAHAKGWDRRPDRAAGPQRDAGRAV